MSTFFMHITIFFASIVFGFIPRTKYTEKLNRNNRRTECFIFEKGWIDKTLLSNDIGITHKYLIHKSDKKDRPTILFIHGLNFDRRVFQRLNKLSKNYELISYELPENSSNYTGNIDDYIVILDDFLTKLNKKNIIMSGTSFGGLIAMRYAKKGAVKTNSLILISTKLAGALRKDYKQSQSLERLLKRKKDYQIFWLMQKLVGDFQKKLIKDGHNDVANLLKIRDINFYRQASYSLSGHRSELDVQGLDIPILIMNGKKDHLIKERDSEEFRKIIPNATIISIEKGSHGLVWIQGDKVSTIINNFLN